MQKDSTNEILYTNFKEHVGYRKILLSLSHILCNFQLTYVIIYSVLKASYSTYMFSIYLHIAQLRKTLCTLDAVDNELISN